MLVLVVGPSGAGKDTLMEGARARLNNDPRYRFVRREITRPAEAGGEDHTPITPETFAARQAAGAYALAWEAHGLGYAIPADIADDLAAGHCVIANVSRAVLTEAARAFPTRILEITAPIDILARRLAARGRETEADIAARLARAVPLPEGLDIACVQNTGPVEDGIQTVLAILAACVSPRA
jgi:phosphonate metabolism protein PhnN/1,5-bisphosphokinase (PRPP-forming)